MEISAQSNPVKVLDSAEWLAFVARWWTARRATASRAGELVDHAGPLLRTGSRHAQAIQLGALLSRAAGGIAGSWRIDAAEPADLRNKGRHYSLALIGADPGPPVGRELVRTRPSRVVSDAERQARALRSGQINAARLQRIFRGELRAIEGRIAAGGSPEERLRETLLLSRGLFESMRALLLAFRLPPKREEAPTLPPRPDKIIVEILQVGPEAGRSRSDDTIDGCQAETMRRDDGDNEQASQWTPLTDPEQHEDSNSAIAGALAILDREAHEEEDDEGSAEEQDAGEA